MVNKLIQAMIVIVIGLALLPVVVEFADSFVLDEAGIAQTGGVYSLVALLPIVYVIILVTGAIAYIQTSRK